MQITKEELEVQGVFIPTKINDELLARFRAGSLIVLNVELVDPLACYNHWRAPRFFQISNKSNMIPRDFHKFIFRLEHNNQFNNYDLYDGDTPFIAWRPDIDMFNKILVCLEKNC